MRRALRILLACIAAALAAGAVITAAALQPAWSDLSVDAFADSLPGYFFAFSAIFVSPFALLAWLLVVVLGESFALRAPLLYSAAGGAVAALTYLDENRWSTLALSVNGFARRELEIMAAAGIIAGFVYWLVAGRYAGEWRAPPAAPDREGG